MICKFTASGDLALTAYGDLKRGDDRFKRIALRREKTATHYASFLALVCGFILIKSVHTA
jgi:hypothetical protein